MVSFDPNRINLNTAVSRAKDTAMEEQWQKEGKQDNPQQQRKKLSMPPERQPMQQKELQRKQLNALNKTNQIHRVTEIQQVDSVEAIEGIEAIQGINGVGRLDPANAGRFDMKQDIADFVKPPAISPEYLTKDAIAQTGQNIMTHLGTVGASDGMIDRAKGLFQEEDMVKSVTEAYKNALIFA